MHPRLVYLLLIIVSCSPKVKKSSNLISFDDVEIPREGTALIGSIVDIKSNEDGLNVTIKIDSFKQGGTGTTFFQKDQEESFTITRRTLTRLEEEKGVDLEKDLVKDRMVLAVISKNMRSGLLQINDIRLP